MGFTLPEHPAGLPIGDGWITDTGTTEICFPYDGSVVAPAPVGSVRHARTALDAGIAAVRAVAALNSATRKEILLEIRRELAARQEDFVELLIAETGKTRTDCQVEVDRSLFTWSSAADEVPHLHGETVPLDMQASGEGMVGFWTRRPIGLVIGVAGFNYPLLLATHKIAPAIAAGCPVICKPAPATPLATLWLTHLVREVVRTAGGPPTAVQLVTGDADVGRALVTDTRIGAVSFTGSAEVGHRIAADAAPRKVLLELGSNAALVVDADANIDRAVEAVLRGGFYGNGQACISVQRVLLTEPVAEEFTNRLLARMPELTVGDPRSDTTRVAPLINEKATERVSDWVARAERAGAKRLYGGEVHDRAVTPTVLTDVPEEQPAWCEEIFGPVVCLRSVSDVDTAFDMVNRSRYGLHASVYTGSLRTAFRAVEELDVGGVVVNEAPGFRSDIMPYGGVKDSGIGREGPRFAIEELTVTRMAIIRPE
jgi:acyl-CoA reductase-like NAD-dependent aldehyde dehydrogenase